MGSCYFVVLDAALYAEKNIVELMFWISKYLKRK